MPKKERKTVFVRLAERAIKDDKPKRPVMLGTDLGDLPVCYDRKTQNTVSAKGCHIVYNATEDPTASLCVDELKIPLWKLNHVGKWIDADYIAKEGNGAKLIPIVAAALDVPESTIHNMLTNASKNVELIPIQPTKPVKKIESGPDQSDSLITFINKRSSGRP